MTDTNRAQCINDYMHVRGNGVLRVQNVSEHVTMQTGLSRASHAAWTLKNDCAFFAPDAYVICVISIYACHLLNFQKIENLLTSKPCTCPSKTTITCVYMYITHTHTHIHTKKIVEIKAHLINIYAFYWKRVDILYTERRTAESIWPSVSAIYELHRTWQCSVNNSFSYTDWFDSEYRSRLLVHRNLAALLMISSKMLLPYIGQITSFFKFSKSPSTDFPSFNSLKSTSKVSLNTSKTEHTGTGSYWILT